MQRQYKFKIFSVYLISKFEIFFIFVVRKINFKRQNHKMGYYTDDDYILYKSIKLNE